jgi:hypothetical protein
MWKIAKYLNQYKDKLQNFTLGTPNWKTGCLDVISLSELGTNIKTSYRNSFKEQVGDFNDITLIWQSTFSTIYVCYILRLGRILTAKDSVL